MHIGSRPALPALTLALITLSGCGISTPITGPSALTTQTLIAGSLHGGQQPIAFATVQLWSAGSSGYGSQGQLFATMQTVDNGQGSFGFTKQPNTDTPYPSGGSTWACPASSDPYMYFVARGGNTQGTHLSSQQNSAAAFLLAIGKCSTITQSSFYAINEVTTAGSLAALTQFFSPVTETVGAPATPLAQQGLANAFALVPTLVDIAAGNPQGRLTWYFNYTLPDLAKTNTLADIIAACINTPAVSSSVCQTLFTNAAPPSPALTSQPSSTFPTAADTLQALWYMFTNPTNGSAAHQANLFGLTSAAAPFQPTLSAQPTDWAISLISYGQDQTVFFGVPLQLAISPLGYASFAAGGGYMQLGPPGDVLQYESFGLYNSSIVFDKYQDFWLGTRSYESYLYSFTPSSNGTPDYGLANGWRALDLPYVIAALPNGDVTWGGRGAPTPNPQPSAGSIYTISSAAIQNAQKICCYQDSTLSVLRTGTGSPIKAMVSDPSGNLWIACNNSNLYELASGSNSLVAAASIGADFIDSVSALAVDASGSVLLPLHPTTGTPQVLRVSGSPSTGYTTAILPGTTSSVAIAVDGAGNIWQASSSTETLNGVVTGYVTAMTNSGTALTGTTGIARPATSTSTSDTLVQNFPVLGPAAGMAIDLAGDIWVSNSGTNLFSTADGPQYSVTELVGAAVPVTPPSVGLFNNTLAQKP